MDEKKRGEPGGAVDSNGAVESRGQTNVYITGLPWDFTLKELVDAISPFGPFLDARVLPARPLEVSAAARKRTATLHRKICHRAIAFVVYSDEKSAQQAIKVLSASPPPRCLSHTFRIKFARFSPETTTTPSPKSNIYISGLPLHSTIGPFPFAPMSTDKVAFLNFPEQVEEIFACYGEIVNSILLPPRRSSKPCVAMLHYHSLSAASRAVAAMNGVVLPGTTTPLLVRFAQSTASAKLAPESMKKRKMTTDHCSQMAPTGPSGLIGPVGQHPIPVLYQLPPNAIPVAFYIPTGTWVSAFGM